ncbi:MAG: DNA (cytosine-5-)-methyltransferase [Pseudomonadota bacterium]
MSTYIPWDISSERRAEYASSSRQSQLARRKAEILAASREHPQLRPRYNPLEEMPQRSYDGLRSLSLFSGGGGLDLGFDRAGYSHVASYDILPFAGTTIKLNRPHWNVYSGASGDVTSVDWLKYRGHVDVVHGGPPCQPFSIAGRQLGEQDRRDMFPEFERAVQAILPKAIIIENVLGFGGRKFESYRNSLLGRLSRRFNLSVGILSAKDFGVPQDRKRFFIIGVAKDQGGCIDFRRIKRHLSERTVRHALNLPSVDNDGLAPTIRCTLTGPRQTTSIANSTASVKVWKSLGIWPHGVSSDPRLSQSYPAPDGLHRLCVEECQLIQGFPLNWQFVGATYQRLGLIGNSVSPPVAYAVATAVSDVLLQARAH